MQHAIKTLELHIKKIEQIVRCGRKAFTYTNQFIICDLTLVFLYFTYHLLVDIHVHRLQLCRQIALGYSPVFPALFQPFGNNIFIVVKTNFSHAIIIPRYVILTY